MGLGWAIAAVIACVGLAAGSPALVAVASVVTGAARVASDLRRRNGFGPATIWGGAMVMTGIADAAGMLATSAEAQHAFFLYAAEQYLLEAMLINFLGGSAILLGFSLASRRGPLRDALPPVDGGEPSRLVWYGFGTVAVVVFLMRVNLISIGGGTISNIYGMGVTLAIFALAREASRRRSDRWLWFVVALTYCETARAVLFEFLRGNMLMPLIALVLGCLVGARTPKFFRRVQFVPMWVLLGIFLMYFSTFGVERVDVERGTERITEIPARHQQNTSSGIMDALARLTSFNQLSQVVRLTATDGFERGATLSYLRYVFVPRFIWPDKPMIAQGRWFAEKIGLGRWVFGGFSNSINMTIPGEWFLNFGWPGAIVGGVLAGFWVGNLWNAARFASPTVNPLGWAYGFYMLYFTWGINIDTEVLPTVLAVYLLFWMAGWILRRASFTTSVSVPLIDRALPPSSST